MSHNIKIPIVAIVGRPNVGKSSLFNRISRKYKSVVDDTPGITRDRHFSQVEWAGKSFLLVDTGGFVSSPKDSLEQEVVYQARQSVEQANFVIFMVEPVLHPDDKEIADILRKSAKPVICVVNKVDNPKDNWSGAEAESLGLGKVIRVSAKLGIRIGDLLDFVVERIPGTLWFPDDDVTRIAVVGAPNVGKSSFVNKLLGKKISIVHPEPGTTRDSVNARFKYFGKEYELIDTAGFQKNPERVNYYSILRTVRSIEECDSAILLIDATKGLTRLDKQIASLVLERFKGLVLVVNKWDLVRKQNPAMTMQEYENRIRGRAQFLEFVPIVFASALTGFHIQATMQVVHQVSQKLFQRVQTAKLNALVHHLQNEYPPPMHRGRRPKIFYVVQTDTGPPEFVFFSKMPQYITQPYRRYIVKKIRHLFDFQGVPFRIIFKDKEKGARSV